MAGFLTRERAERNKFRRQVRQVIKGFGESVPYFPVDSMTTSLGNGWYRVEAVSYGEDEVKTFRLSMRKSLAAAVLQKEVFGTRIGRNRNKGVA